MLNDLSLCYKDPSQPGPSHYDPKYVERPKNAKNYPFGKSMEKQRPLRCKEIRPGPGRYHPKIEKKIKGSGWTYVFKSKLPRTKNVVKEPYNNFWKFAILIVSDVTYLIYKKFIIRYCVLNTDSYSRHLSILRIRWIVSMLKLEEKFI